MPFDFCVLSLNLFKLLFLKMLQVAHICPENRIPQQHMCSVVPSVYQMMIVVPSITCSPGENLCTHPGELIATVIVHIANVGKNTPAHHCNNMLIFPQQKRAEEYRRPINKNYFRRVEIKSRD